MSLKDREQLEWEKSKQRADDKGGAVLFMHIRVPWAE